MFFPDGRKLPHMLSVAAGRALYALFRAELAERGDPGPGA
jgi:hypothetical protein